MSIKTDVLELFENNRGKYISGEEMANTLGVSRNGVWKAVKSLIAEGYDINGVNNKGYCMSVTTDVMSAQGIKKYLLDEIIKRTDIEVFKSIDSTNTSLKRLASQGVDEWKIIIAQEQTEGKGRMNRKFYSPSGTGIYMSILLRPDMEAREALFITTMAAVAVSDAIEKVTGISTGIKWVNDIFCGDRKVSGILTEASMNVENGHLDYAVLGIGINVLRPADDFPEDIRNIASAIIENYDEFDIKDIRNKISAEVINNVYKYYCNIEKHEFMKQYKERSILVGKKVYITSDADKRELMVKGIDDNAGLIVEDDKGNEMILSSGEVSVKQL